MTEDALSLTGSRPHFTLIANLARGLLAHEQSFNEMMGELTPWAGEEFVFPF